MLNGDSTVAQLTSADTSLSDKDILAYAQLAGALLKLPIFYLEYSGTYGDPEIVHQVRQMLPKTQLLYGGGIHTTAQAREMAQWADTVIIGNALYEDLQQALETVRAVRGLDG